MTRFLSALCATLIAAATGCSTIESLTSDDPATPKIYGGVRLHLRDQSEADAGRSKLGRKIAAAVFDLPLSAICDTLLLPATVFLEPESPEKLKAENERKRRERSDDETRRTHDD